MTAARWFVAVFVAFAITLFFIYDLDDLLQLSQLKTQQESLTQMVADQPFESAAFFMAAYILVTALSLPGATLMTLLAGALFGFYFGSLIVSFASTIGATLAMLTSRFLIREWAERRFSGQAKKINSGMLKEGAYYLFSLRLIPLIPFFVINLALGLTRIKVVVFYVVSQLGMLPATFIYVNAGQELARLDSFEDILSIELLSALLLLAVFPLVTKHLVEMFRKRKSRLRFRRPRRFDNDIVVIGAGSGGLVSALIGATVNAKVTLIEENQMGGDCLNTGCVPSKSLIRAANLMADISSADEFGIQVDSARLNFSDVMARVRTVIKQIEPNDSIERYEAMGVDVRTGHAEIISPFEVAVGGKSITTRNIVVATGAAPIWIEIDGLPDDRCFTSETIWNLTELPENLVVIGAGAIGVELSQAFARLGSKVTLVEQAERILVNEDVDVSERISQCLQNDAVEIKTSYRALRAATDENGIHLVCQGQDQVKVPFDAVLLALGRLPRTKGFGLEALGIELLDNGAIKVDEYLRTQYDNVYAVGDVSGPYQFTHTASHMAWYAVVNALFGVFWRFKVDYSVIPACTFTSPEVARVGLNEQQARQQDIAFEVTVFELSELDRARIDQQTEGFVKVLTPPGKDRILGVTIVGSHAGEVISEFTLAMKNRIGLNQVLSTIHIYPTFAEMNKFVAGAYRREHKPEWALRLAERFHRLRRGK